MRENIRKAVEHRTLTLAALSIIAVLAAGTISANSLFGSSSSGDLVADYRFDTGAGDTAYDTAGGSDGMINGASWTNGIEGKALEFDGNDDYVGTPVSIDQTSDGESYTFCAWSRLDATGGGTQQIVSTDDGGYDWSILKNKNNGEYELFDGTDVLSSGIQTDTDWHHVCGVFDSSRGKAELYVDGVSRGTSDLGYDSSDNNIQVGSNPGAQEDWNGKIDEVLIYSRALNSSQIRSIHSSGVWRVGSSKEANDPSNVLDISFQHQNSTHVYDTSGEENHGIPRNGVSQEPALNCKEGRCYGFDGQNDYAEIADDSSLDSAFGGSLNFTMMSWVYVRNFENYAAVINKADGGYWSQTTAGIWSYNDGLAAVIGSDEPGNNAGSYVRIAHKPGLDEWHHVTSVGNGTHLKMYVDGRLRGSKKIKDYIKANLTSNDASVTIGRRHDSASESIDGKIGNVKVFDRPLSQREIARKTQGLESQGAAADYGFNRDAGDVAHDSSSNGNDARITSSSAPRPERAEGVDGNALKMNTDDAVDIPDSQSVQDALSGEEATIAFWVDLGDISQSYNNWFAWTATNDAGSQSARLEHTGGGNNLYVRWIVDPASAGFAGDGGVWARGLSDMTGERFLHVSTFETTDSGFQVRTFINDELESESTSNDDAVLASASNIGSFSPSEAPSTIDNLQIYPYAVSKAGVKEMYQKGKSGVGDSESSSTTGNLEKNLVLEQSFDRIETCGQSDTISCPSGMSGEVAVDESGNANHGELVNNFEVEGAKECKKGSCISFDKDGHIHIPMSSVPTDNQERTLTAWAKLDSGTDTAQDQDIVGWGNQNQAEMNAITYGLGNSYCWGYWGYGSTYDLLQRDDACSANFIEEDEWYHIAVKYDGSDQYIYINGDLMNTANVDLNTSSTDIYVGRVPTRGSNLDGSVDEIKMYNRSLPDEEIWNLYTNGRDKASGMAGYSASYSFSAGKVGSEGNPAKGCKQIHDLRPGTPTGEYWIKPDYSVESFKVQCEMSENGGGWIKIRMDNRKNQYWWTKYDNDIDDGDSRDPGGSTYSGWNWTPFSHVSSNSDLGTYDFASYTGDTELDLTWTQPNDASNTYTREEMDAVRSQVDQISSTTEAFSTSSDDDGCRNGEAVLKKTENGPGYLITHYTTSSGQFIRNFETESEMNNYNDVGYLIPAVLEYENGGPCSGPADFVAFGYEKDYTLVRSSETYGPGGKHSETADIQGDPQWVEEGGRTALDFDGTDGYVSVPHSSDISMNKQVTVSAWVSQDGPGDFQRITDKGGAKTLWVDDNGDTCVRLTATEGGASAQTCFSTGIEKNEWHHIAFNYDSSEGQVELFVDGELFGTSSYYSGEMSGNANDLVIGSTGGSRHWNGKIDEVRIYPYALNQDQVERVANGGEVRVG